MPSSVVTPCAIWALIAYPLIVTYGGISPVSIVFDTRCIPCSRWVCFLLRNEADTRLHFVGVWSLVELALATRYGFDERDLQKTYLVVVEGVALIRSDAGLALLGHMEAPWRWRGLMRFVPKPVRDGMYDLIARNRYCWFGTKEVCLLPDLGGTALRSTDRNGQPCQRKLAFLTQGEPLLRAGHGRYGDRLLE